DYQTRQADDNCEYRRHDRSPGMSRKMTSCDCHNRASPGLGLSRSYAPFGWPVKGTKLARCLRENYSRLFSAPSATSPPLTASIHAVRVASAASSYEKPRRWRNAPTFATNTL